MTTKKTVALHSNWSSLLQLSTKWLFWGTAKRNLFLVKLKTWFLKLFWRWTPPPTFIWNLAKPLKQLFLRKCFCFNISQGITVFTNRFVLLFSEANLITRKSVFRRNFQLSVGPKHLALTTWKRYYSTAPIASVRYLQAEDFNAYLHETLSTWWLVMILVCIYTYIRILCMYK